MAVITPSHVEAAASGRGPVCVWYGTSAANQADTLTTGNAADGLLGTYRLMLATLTWSTAATKTCTVKIDSVLGAAYDCLLDTLSTTAVVSDTFIPGNDLILLPGDTILMSAEASGAGGVTASLAVYLERL
jgi:hypothetical protein